MQQQHQSQDTTLLQEVYHSAAVGERGVGLMLEKSRDGGMSAKLSGFKQQYGNIKKDAADRLSAHGHQPHDPGTLETASQWFGVQLGTLADQSPSRMAEMLIEGSTKNMVDSIQDIKRNHQAKHSTRELAGRLVSLENDSLSAMKTYLS